MIEAALLDYREKSTIQTRPYRPVGRKIPLVRSLTSDEIEEFSEYAEDMKKIYSCTDIKILQGGIEYDISDLENLIGHIQVCINAKYIGKSNGFDSELMIIRNFHWKDAEVCARELGKAIISILKGKF